MFSQSRFFGLLAGLFFLAAGPASAAVGARVELTAEHTFSPFRVEIAVGDSVVFANVSGANHTVTADPALVEDPENVRLPAGATAFNSGRIVPGQVFSHVFTVPGVYQYVCLPHEGHGMIGQVIVRE